VEINIHEQIYEWREVMGAKGEFSTTKKAAMRVADKLLSNPRAYRAAADAGDTALKVLPRFAIYNRLNAWGRRREIPSPTGETFHQWYARNRAGKQPPNTPAETTAPKAVDDERA
jgi:L-lactate dehydrogenase complex protein LldF